ncbi:flagellar biosynthesis protein FlhF [Polynucleobacter sp. AP-Ainpum-60-G11]|uniref:flagellar biosynthesis protein FlhF n=1 Tax=Polynucleobacter sp. AP-Ainpum-60-G11 TaxID=2576926 RepID=UPI001BFEDA10|nr:flagellar biosynthesis protein FlhF [Polynucleobacter sp. AP-Ainpum-60-G11]QWE27131.1 flagellar biosynthesis protein FlhF [Polynucleobacter sp. AP-Ainpum-60-G11]
MGPQKFIAANTADALKLIRTELGSDAMVLSTKDTDQGVEIIAITSQDLANLSTRSESLDSFSNEASPFSERSMAQSGLSDKFENAIARRAQAPAPKPYGEIPAGSLRRNPARAGRSVRAPGAEAFLPTSFNDVERIHRSDSSVINPSNNDAIFNASAAANAKAAQDVAALNAARVSALNAAQAHRISETSLQKQAAPAASPSPAVTNIFESGSSPKVEKLLSEISEVKFLLQSHVAGNFWGSIQQENTHVTEIVKHLLNSGFSPKLCAEIARNLPEDLSLPALIKNAREQVKCMIKTSHAFDIFDRGGVFAFIGPTGVGKTTTVAKIAARCVLRYGRNQVALLTTDTYRIGAQEQLKTFAKILGLSVTAVRDSEDLAAKIKDFSNRKIVLLDTAGVSQRDTLMVEQSQLLEHGSNKAKRILVMSSTTDLRTQEEVISLHNQAMQNANGEKLDSVIITKIDEAAHLAPVIDSVIRNDLSVMFVSNGQRVPEDLSQPDINYLSHRAMAMRAFSETFSITDEQVPALLSDHLGDWIRKVNQ